VSVISNRPIIGMAWPGRDYKAAIEHAGAEIRELRPERDSLPEALETCDGLLLTGGPDVDPREYGDQDTHPSVEIDPARDAYELALARYALDRDVPLFAICRGAQVLNVAAGGTLIQDLPTANPSSVSHSVDQPKTSIAHEVAVTPNTCLSVLMTDRLGTSGPISVNSRHHQSIKDLAPGFLVSATAPDGVIEAIERSDAEFCVGVQWHPENFWKTGDFSTLFAGLVSAARRCHDRRRNPR
jgi:putative glutamine amidotransferase